MNSVIISHNVDNEIMALGCQTPTSLFMTRYENYFNAGIELIFLEKVNLQSGLLLLLLLLPLRLLGCQRERLILLEVKDSDRVVKKKGACHLLSRDMFAVLIQCKKKIDGLRFVLAHLNDFWLYRVT